MILKILDTLLIFFLRKNSRNLNDRGRQFKFKEIDNFFRIKKTVRNKKNNRLFNIII